MSNPTSVFEQMARFLAEGYDKSTYDTRVKEIFPGLDAVTIENAVDLVTGFAFRTEQLADLRRLPVPKYRWDINLRLYDVPVYIDDTITPGHFRVERGGVWQELSLVKPKPGIIEFLDARLREEHLLAEWAGSGTWTTGCECEGECVDDHGGCQTVKAHEKCQPGGGIHIYPEGGHNADQAAFIAAHDPARVLREVSFKADLISTALEHAAAHDNEYGCGCEPDKIRAGQCPDERPEGQPVLRLLAGLYDDHEDYNSDWALGND